MVSVFKFGGASVKDAEGVKNVTSIVRKASQPLVVVISAMGKMTNAFEALTLYYFNREHDLCLQKQEEIVKYHQNIIESLFGDAHASPGFNRMAETMTRRLQQAPSLHYDFEYDQIVSFGEMFSTTIVADFWAASGLNNQWVDVRTIIKTDDLYRDANVNWELTNELMKETFLFDEDSLYLTQGFLGGTRSNLTTTLGREGSDYSAAIIGYVMDAEAVTIWKDVPGVLNGDPRWYKDAIKINELSYNEAIELSFYGAQVIHPKTLKPLQNKNIALHVKSFIDPESKGTVICERSGISEPIPVYILKRDQVFLTVSPHDFSFIMEDKLIEILSVFSRYRIKINLMQSSALNFSACFDDCRNRNALLEDLKTIFSVRYNNGVNLLTIRQYTPDSIEKMTSGREVIDSQITRKVARFVLR
jgi:aspartate kinase